MTKLPECPTCKGTGKVTITVTEFRKPSSSVEMNCVSCGGRGAVKKQKAASIVAETESWCRCGDAGMNVRYYADGESKTCRKHHWTHEPGCGRIVQVG